MAEPVRISSGVNGIQHRPQRGRALFPAGGTGREIPGLLVIEFLGGAAGHAQRLPAISREMFRQQHNLSYMVGIVRQLPVDGLQHRVRFAPNGYRAGQIVVGKGRQGSAEAGPALPPKLD